MYGGESCFRKVDFLTWDGSLEEEEKRMILGLGFFMLIHVYLVCLSWAKELFESSVNTVYAGKKEECTILHWLTEHLWPWRLLLQASFFYLPPLAVFM